MSFKKNISYRTRSVEKGGIYHVTQRAPGKEMLFLEENDCLMFLSFLKDWVKKFNIELFSFCIMPNHFHFLLGTNEPNLSKAMHSLGTSYGMRFNIKYQRKGHVFCGVYRALRCLDDMHFIGSSIYIHLNPQKARIVKDALDYRWSSAGIYADSRIKSFVNSKVILEMISDDSRKASFLYRDMLKEYSCVEYGNIIEDSRAGIIFCKTISKTLTVSLQDRNIRKDFIDKENALDAAIVEFRNKKRKRRPKNIQAKIYLIEQLKSRGYRMVEIAKILEVSRQTLANLTNKVRPLM